MYFASSDYKTNIIDGSTPQDFLLLRVDSKSDPITGFFSALDGDFTYNGVDVEQEICKDGNLAFGGTPAGAASFELLNRDKVLSDFPWGNMAAYIGVRVAESTFTVPADALCFVTIGGNNYYGKSDGVYKGTTRIYNSSGVAITGLVGDCFGGRLIALGLGVCVSINISTGTATEETPSRHMAKKLLSGVSINFKAYTGSSGATLRAERYDVSKGTYETYEYVNVGYYVVERPDSLQNEVVSVRDANNILSLLDVDATSFLSGVTYPITVGNFVLAVLNGLGIDIVAPTSNTVWSTSIASDPFGNASYTKRDLLGFCAELLGCVVAFDGCYYSSGYVLSPCVLKFVPPCGSSSVETVAWDRVQTETLAVKDYTTPQISKIQLKKPDGTTTETSITRSGSDAGIYQISGNPMANSISDSMLASAALGGFAFHPTSCTVISADPTVEMGDLVSIKVSAEDTEPETDAYGRPTGNTHTNTPAVVPLMSRTLHWQGNCTANYQATGDKERKVDKSTSVYQSAYSQRYSEIAIHDFDLSLDPEDVFNRLTDYGTIQGIFRDSQTGDLYINGIWIQADTIRSDAIETTDGVSWVDVIATLLANASQTHPVALGEWEAYGSGSQFTLVQTASPKKYVRFFPSGQSIPMAAAPYTDVTVMVLFYNGSTYYALCTDATGFVEVQAPPI